MTCACVTEADEKINDMRLCYYFVLDTGTEAQTHVLIKTQRFRTNIWLQGFEIRLHFAMAYQTEFSTPDKMT